MGASKTTWFLSKSEKPFPRYWRQKLAQKTGQKRASHGQNTLGTHVPRITRHGDAENTAGRVPGTRTGAADLDYERNVYTEKRVM